MNTNPPSWVWRWTVGALLLWGVAGVLFHTLAQLKDLFLIVLVSFLLACAVEPSVNSLERRGWRRGWATNLVLLGTVSALASAVVAAGAVVLGQLNELYTAIPQLIDSFAPVAARLGVELDGQSMADQLATRVQDSLQHSAPSAVALGTVLIGKILAGALILFYLVVDGPRLRRSVCSTLPARRQQIVLEIWNTAIDKAGGYLAVRAVLAVIATAVSWAAFAVLGVEYPAALAVWVGLVSQIVPVVGAYLAGLLPVVVAVTQRPSLALLVLIYLVLYQQVENFLIAPRLGRHLMAVHPAIGFVAVLAGGAIAGAAGALIAVPVVATAQAVISATVERHQLIDSDLLNEQERPQPRPRKPRPERRSRRSEGGHSSKS